MTGGAIARIAWTRLDGPGEDRCTLSRLDGGWMLIGHAWFHAGDGTVRFDYVVRCDAGWLTQSADVSGHAGRDRIAWHIERDCGGAWFLNGIAQDGLSGADDVDLSFTPASNLMPLRRLGPDAGARLDARAAWLRFPEAALQPLDQTYRRVDAATVAYEAVQTSYATRLGVNADGFVTRYPDLWEVSGEG